ncbi:MAG: ATP-binding cassette domain-containing protein, partial [Bacteroidaceae bacterium]|nr:ATP-binding cassette domain-containing protein [Bacteroidaceae bacterium]
LVCDNIKHITFRDSYGDTDGMYYYQLRWNQHDIADNTPTVGQLLDDVYTRLAHKDEKLRDTLRTMFHLDEMRGRHIISLSSGELRKFQLTRVLLAGPRVLIIDNPFIGLDAQTRDQLKGLLATLARETRIMIILVLSKTDDIPDFITHILPVEGLEAKPVVPREGYRPEPVSLPALPAELRDCILGLPQKDLSQVSFYPRQGGDILKFNGISLRYGTRTILKDLSWTVEEGERWALSGENGAGKSALLSLVCADNPQSYACDFELFGHKRGSGESIWEIKRHIGYVSPEMHRAYQKDLPAIGIVGSGLSDSVGLYTRLREEQKDICRLWMRVFGIEHLAERTFLKLSSGEQRLCLLARAFVKDPELLILDEPLHGLDDRNRARTQEIIDTFCQRRNKTLVMVTHYKEELPRCITRELHLIKNK